MEDPAHYGTIPEPKSCHATAMPDQSNTKNKHDMGPFQNLNPVMLQLCQIKAAPKINISSLFHPRTPYNISAESFKILKPMGQPHYNIGPMGLPHLNATLLYIFYISSFVFSYRCLFLSCFLYPPKTTKPPFFYNISPKGIPFLRH